MKKVVGINQRLKTFNDKFEESTIPTHRQLMIDCLGMSIPRDARDAAKVTRLLSKLEVADKEDFSFEDAEFELVMQKLNDNPRKFAAGFLGQTVELMDQATTE